MIRLELVRHGEPDWSSGDPALTDRGRKQAEKLAQAYAKTSVDRLYVSPLARATETAEPVGMVLGLEPMVVPWAAELALPDLSGQNQVASDAYFKNHHAQPMQSLWAGFDGCEAWNDFYRRVSTGIVRLVEEAFDLKETDEREDRVYADDARGGHVVVVAHAGSIGCMLCHLLNLRHTPWIYLKLAIGYACIARLGVKNVSGGLIWSLDEFNGHAHLGSLYTGTDS